MSNVLNAESECNNFESTDETVGQGSNLNQETKERSEDQFPTESVANVAEDNGLESFLSYEDGIESNGGVRHSIILNVEDKDPNENLFYNLVGPAFEHTDTAWDFEVEEPEDSPKVHSITQPRSMATEDTRIYKPNRLEQENRTDSESSIIKECIRPLTPEPIDFESEKKKSKKKPSKSERKALPVTVKIFKTHVDRDPNKVNEDLKVHFNEIINEPKGFYTPKFSWSLSHEMYNFGKGCCYSLIALIFGIPMAFLWGIVFAVVACINVWILAPVLRGFKIKIQCISQVWDLLVSTCFDPFYKSLANMFSKITVRTDKFVV